MADTLGLHVAPEGISAVRLDAVAGTDPVVVVLGASGPVAPCIVAPGDGGAVLVGDAARGAEGPVVDDPMERAAAGRIGALGAVINHVVGRAAMATGSAPRRLAVVVPDDWDAAARDRVVEAGTVAGVPDTVAVPRSAATAQPVEVEASVAVAAGAARVASLAAAPLVTREDLGETVVSKPRVEPAAGPTTGSVSVFDEDAASDDEEPPPPVAPARPAPVPVAAQPHVPAPQPPTPTQTHTLRYEPPRRRVPAGLIVAVVLVGLIAAVGGAIVVFGGDTDDAATEDPTDTLTTTEAPPTTTATAPPTTGSAPTSTIDTSSTTVPVSTTEPPPTTEPTTTTTRPLPVATPGDVTLVETGLRLTGGDLLLFDQDVDVVITAVTDLLGEPDLDDPWAENDFCLGARSRFVTWGDLELVFTEDELGSEIGRFTQWFAGGFEDPEGLVTLGGVGVSATVAFLEATFGDSLVLVEAVPGDPTGLFAATNPGSGALLNGITTSRDPDGVVTSLWAGDSCTRVFT